MLKSVTFIKDLFCFKSGDGFTFEQLTLLVGDQGCGKSTLLKLLSTNGLFGSTSVIEIKGDGSFLYHDFEKDSHRTDTNKINPSSSDYCDQVIKLFDSQSMSHGEYTNGSFSDFDKIERDVIILDEPDMSLSIRSVKKLVAHVKAWVKSGKQVIMSCHHPYLIEEFDRVFSLEHGEWMDSKDFIQTHLN